MTIVPPANRTTGTGVPAAGQGRGFMMGILLVIHDRLGVTDSECRQGLRPRMRSEPERFHNPTRGSSDALRVRA